MDLDAILDDALKAFEHQEVVLHKTSHTENGIVGKPTVASSNIEGKGSQQSYIKQQRLNLI